MNDTCDIGALRPAAGDALPPEQPDNTVAQGCGRCEPPAEEELFDGEAADG